MSQNFGIYGIHPDVSEVNTNRSNLSEIICKLDDIHDFQISTLLYTSVFECVIATALFLWPGVSSIDIVIYVSRFVGITTALTIASTFALDHLQTDHINLWKSIYKSREQSERMFNPTNTLFPSNQMIAAMAEAQISEENASRLRRVEEVKKPRKRSVKDIKSDISKLSKEKRTELVRELCNIYIEGRKEGNQKQNNRMSDLDIVTESDLIKEGTEE